MSNSEEVKTKLEIKVVINMEKCKVLFAEAGSDFTDVLLSFLLLPLGTIVRVLDKYYGYDSDEVPDIGSLSTLVDGVVKFDSFHFSEQDSRTMLLNPTSCYESKLCKLRLNVSSIKPTAVSDSGKTYEGVLTDGAASFIITDDLRVVPNVAGSIIKTLSNLGIAVTDIDGAETINVTLGLKEIMALLQGSLVFRNPLYALLFYMNLAPLKYKEGNALSHQIEERATSQNCKKMILTVMMKKSTNKLLFAQADHEFINFLFSLLTLPLGRVVWYLGSRTGLTSMDNLHRSVADNFDDKLMASESVRGWLMKPELPNYSNWLYSNEFYHLNFDPTISQKHVKESRMYMVRDDLTVTPLGMTSSLAVLNRMNISLSDIKELELQVGLEEGLSILKAALTSTTALTDGLINPMLMKQPKQEN